MDIIRVFPKRRSMTPDDSMVFIGEPGLFRPYAKEVHVSCSFTWEKKQSEHLVEAWRQYYPIVKLGGPAYGNITHNFLHGRYIKEGVTFTSRGCNNKCPWCFVPEREGKIYEIPDFVAGDNIQDNNLLQCSNSHLDKVFSMLKTQCGVTFGGGLDAKLLKDDIAERLRSIKIKQIFLASDTEGAIKPLRRAINRLNGLTKDKIRCYVLIGYNGETIPQAEIRLKNVFEAGCLPYAMLYQDQTEHYKSWSKEWTQFSRLWQRPAAIKAIMKNESLTFRRRYP